MTLRRLWPLLRYWQKFPPLHVLARAWLMPDGPGDGGPEVAPLTQEQLDAEVRRLGGTPWRMQAT